METKKVLAVIFSLVFVAIFGFVLSWGIINFNKVKDGMSGTELYTSEDLKNSYQDLNFIRTFSDISSKIS